ncbi:MAG: gluconokinase [Mycobacteriales bacterium]
MGVSGCGKTTVGRALADRLGWDFEEGDALHPPDNIAKMAAGYPLTDDDRWPWLRRIGDWIDGEDRAKRRCVVTCSALKRAYRDLITHGRPDVAFVHLIGSRTLIAERLTHRHGHFMPSSLLDSQFRDLQPLQPDEVGLGLDIAAGSDAIVGEVTGWLND